MSFTSLGACHGVGSSFSTMQSVATNKLGTFRRFITATNAEYTFNRQVIKLTKPDGTVVTVDERDISGGGAFIEAFETGEVVIGQSNPSGLTLLVLPKGWPAVAMKTLYYSGFNAFKFDSTKSERQRRLIVTGATATGSLWLVLDLNKLAAGDATAWVSCNQCFSQPLNGESLQYLTAFIDHHDHAWVVGCNAKPVGDGSVLNYQTIWAAWSPNPCDSPPQWFAGHLGAPLASPFDPSADGPALQMIWGVQSRMNNNFLISAAEHEGRLYVAYASSPYPGNKLLRFDDYTGVSLTLASVDPNQGPGAIRHRPTVEEQSAIKNAAGNIMRAVSGGFCTSGGELYFVGTDDDLSLVTLKRNENNRFSEVRRTPLPLSGAPETPHYATMRREGFDGVLRGSLTMIQLTPSQVSQASLAQMSEARAFAIDLGL